ncbi:MAG: Flp pilus assembly protein CpaB, partial [Pseudomonadota bacterium]|nr:Flp pilus assembly protein CpaB [Pseudomonadota bacterium]
TAARVIVLVTALGAGGIAAYLAYGSGETPVAPLQPAAKVDTTDILVASTDIAFGTALSSTNVKWQAWPNSALTAFYVRKTANAGADQIAGAIARTSFLGGEPIRDDKLVRAGGSGYMSALIKNGMRAIAIEISPENGVAGFVLPNDRVDVLLTKAEKSQAGETYTGETILTNVRVLAIDQAVEEKSGQRVVIGKLATLELSPHDAEALALARRLGTVSIVLRSLSEKTDDGEAIAAKNADRINIIRFGVNSSVTAR